MLWQAAPALVIHLVLTMGVSFILATVNVFFKDIEYIWNVVSMLIMYCSAIFYAPERLLKSNFGWILKYNPVYCIIDMFRGATMGYMCSTWNFLYSSVFAVVVLGLGLLIFKANQDKFILHI